MGTFKQELDKGSVRYPGIGYASGFDFDTKAPADTRTVVKDVDAMRMLKKTYPSMRVTALNAPEVGGDGVVRYPQAVTYECLVDKEPNPSGYTTLLADWKPVSANTSGTYKGEYNAATDTPILTTDSGNIRANLVNGDWYKVKVGDAAVTNLDGITALVEGDQLWWNGTQFTKYEGGINLGEAPLYTEDESATFEADVISYIFQEGIKIWEAKAYKQGEVISYTYAIGTFPNIKNYTDVWQARKDLTIAESGLPDHVIGNIYANWLLLATTNPAKIGIEIIFDNTAGVPATATRTVDDTRVVLTPEEIDARIREFGGKPAYVFGGNAATFLTASLDEEPNN